MMRRVLVRSDRCIGCRSCEIACIKHHIGEAIDDSYSRALAVPRIKVECGLLDRAQAPVDRSDDNCYLGNLRKISVVLCQHCDDPECVIACVAGALTKDPVVIVAGNRPLETKTGPMYVFGEIEGGNRHGAMVVSAVLLAVSLAILVALNLLQRRSEDRA